MTAPDKPHLTTRDDIVAASDEQAANHHLDGLHPHLQLAAMAIPV